MKKVFHLFFLGMTAFVIARPSHAQTFNTMSGVIGPKTELSVKTGIESRDEVALASFCESAPDCGNRGQRLGNSCGKGSGKGCGNVVGNWLDNTQLTFGADSYKSLGDSGLTG